MLLPSSLRAVRAALRGRRPGLACSRRRGDGGPRHDLLYPNLKTCDRPRVRVNRSRRRQRQQHAVDRAADLLNTSGTPAAVRSVCEASSTAMQPAGADQRSLSEVAISSIGRCDAASSSTPIHDPHWHFEKIASTSMFRERGE
jgi:hypothetical protein